MDSIHNTLVYIAKTGGLLYFVVFSIAVLIYVFWPGNRKTFENAANSILTDEDHPCQ